MKDKKALVIIAHGSRRAQSNEEVKQLANQVAQLDDETFDVVSAAFLEIAKPSIVDALQQCANQGANHITVYPYFLSAGRHVVEDIPAEIEKFKLLHQNTEVEITDYLGRYFDLPKLILDMIKQ